VLPIRAGALNLFYSPIPNRPQKYAHRRRTWGDKQNRTRLPLGSQVLAEIIKRMNAKSAKTFVWASVISLLLGVVVVSPVGSTFLYAISALVAPIPIVIGGWKLRVAGVVMLAVSLVLLTATYPKFDSEMTRYKQRAHQKSPAVVQPTISPQEQLND
jgi:hypothetical protein